jgi:FkbM family methyltransferase
MRELRHRMQVESTRLLTRYLRALGLRDGLVRWRAERSRSRRFAAEARGSDRRSKPALHELDAKLNAIIDMSGGFFVEAGAHDGFTQSNTYWLERFRGWRGILVEPIPEMAAEARLSRPTATVIQCALVSADDPRERVTMRFGDLMSVVDGVKEEGWPGMGTVLGWRDPYDVEVETRSLSSILDEQDAPEIDLLSLDTEGFEASALRGLDLTRHAPRYIVVEIHEPARDRPPIDRALGDRYLAHGWLSPVDLLYVREDVAAATARPGERRAATVPATAPAGPLAARRRTRATRLPRLLRRPSRAQGLVVIEEGPDAGDPALAEVVDGAPR